MSICHKWQQGFCWVPTCECKGCPSWFVKKPLFGPKSQGKGGKNGNGLVLKVGCNTKN
jgi:hypothetical protein